MTAIDTGLCEPFTADGCFDGLPVPGCSPAGPIACVDGECVDCSVEECPDTTCAACATPSIAWTSSSAGTNGADFLLTDCRTVTSSAWGCPTELPCIDVLLPCPQCSSGAGQTGALLQNALGHPDVVAALADQASFGAPTPAGTLFRVSVGADEITISDTECGDTPDCRDVPEAVRALRVILEDISLVACVLT